jgi:hypothetical protein
MEFKSRLLRRMRKEEMERALTRLGQILREREVTGEIAVFGGAAIVLGFGFREGTRDVDALVLEAHGQVMQAAQQVGEELRLPPNWLNEQATIYLSKRRDFRWFRTYPSEGQFGLRVLVASPQYLLAMKLLALRLYSEDVGDIVRLARQLNRTTEEGLLQLLRQYYPEEKISTEKLVEIRDLVRQINAPQEP